MAITNIREIPTALKHGDRLLGLDLGSKTIGVAITDSNFTVASPLQIIRRKKFSIDVVVLQNIIKKRCVGGIILGLPKNMDGSEGPRAQSTRQFAENFLKYVDIPIVLWDERLSTIAVNRVLINEADLSRQKRSKVVDKLAASFILQGAIDLISN